MQIEKAPKGKIKAFDDKQINLFSQSYKTQGF